MATSRMFAGKRCQGPRNIAACFGQKSPSKTTQQEFVKHKTQPQTSSSSTLPETNGKFAPENRPFAPIGKDRIPTIHFQGLC